MCIRSFCTTMILSFRSLVFHSFYCLVLNVASVTLKKTSACSQGCSLQTERRPNNDLIGTSDRNVSWYRHAFKEGSDLSSFVSDRDRGQWTEWCVL